MSPASLRYYRAERLLREEFRSLRAGVIASARAKLRACGAELDDGDLDACYAQAWQGLYAVTLQGEDVLNPAGWLSVATFRRALDEHRAARRRRELSAHLPGAGAASGNGRSEESDPAGALDRRLKLGQLFEALRLRLSARERRAFALCYLQGLSRGEAAGAMGISERRMRKLMDGRGAGEAGTNAKVGALVHTIRAEKWCEEQGSLMRGLAYGVLDPRGERHRLAVAHTRSCPACRSYVASLRGLAALLPPPPGLLALLGAASDATRHASAHVAAAAGARGRGALVGPAAAASGTAGASAAGGGWLLVGGGAGAKLAATCLLALGLGAGCAALGVPGGSPHRRPAAHQRAAAARARAIAATAARGQRQTSYSAAVLPAAASASPAGSQSAVTPAALASREFGPEQAGAAEASPSAHSNAPRASAAAAHEFTGAEASPSPASHAATSAAANEAPAPESAAAGAATAREGGSTAAQREFSPG